MIILKIIFAPYIFFLTFIVIITDDGSFIEAIVGAWDISTSIFKL